MRKSGINFIFNAHLPFVRHPEYPKFLEEDWLFEAMNESYLPLLRMMFRLRDEGLAFRFVFSLSPTLCAMLDDELLNTRFSEYLDEHIELGDKEISRLARDRQTKALAVHYRDELIANRAFYTEVCGSRILNAFNTLSNEGFLELITTTATHAYLPVYKDYPIAVNAQVETGVLEHIRHFDKMPEGFWLPECGYYPGLEEVLRRHNIRWTSLGSQALVLSPDECERGSYSPVKCPNGLYCFVRDVSLTSLVWSDTEGYPTDSVYRDFYRDIGFDLPMDYIRPYIHEPEVRSFTGFKYCAVTGSSHEKNVYVMEEAAKRVVSHARNFLYNVKSRTANLDDILDTDPLYTVSFDAELFGHWWYEGVSWLENIIRLAGADDELCLMTPSDFIAQKTEVQTLRPACSSWGDGGYSAVWVDSSSNAWLYRHIFKALERMNELAERFPEQKSLKQRFLNQAARETLLLMASDWPFIIHNQTSRDYAERRIVGHLENLNLVYDNMCKNAVNTEWLVKAEKRDNLFRFIDYNMMNRAHLDEPSPIFTTDFTNEK
jgi:1,4-alpha-glucan branching enzyme